VTRAQGEQKAQSEMYLIQLDIENLQKEQCPPEIAHRLAFLAWRRRNGRIKPPEPLRKDA
jgi:hypothetical protein